MKKLSIIVPVYFNELNLDNLYEQLKIIIERASFDYEIIFVDDGSEDNSYLKLLNLRKIDEKIKIIKLSKNYGSHIAILAGIGQATGDCMTAIAADLQDPPEIILEMYKKWEEGNKTVLAVRKDREDPFLQKFLSNTYYKLMRKYAVKNMPDGGFDCFLIDREIANNLKNMQEKNSTIMGQILWCGYKVAKVYYVRREREHGKSMWTLSKKLKLFIDSFLSFSYVPIKFMSLVGMLFSILGFIGIIYMFINKILHKISIQGWTSIVILILLSSGIQMIMIGVIGEYLWRTLDEVKKRPIYLIEEKIGFND